MQARLTEAIESDAPIASGREAPRHESMNGLDVTARWELLTCNEHPVPEPENEDLTHRPPTERDAMINPKYGFQETFVRVKFTGTTESYQQRHRSFRHFFACQDPLLTPPPKEQCPNFKVDEFFRWLRHIWKEAWLLGEDFSMDEQTTKMQGKSEYKTRCGKFKRLGDGIQGDCIADDGYTWDFYFRNEPVDKDLLTKGFCPMHCRLLHMFKNLRESGHGNKMDNLFHSVKLALARGN